MTYANQLLHNLRKMEASFFNLACVNMNLHENQKATKLILSQT